MDHLHSEKTNNSSSPSEPEDHKSHSTKEKLKHLVHISKHDSHHSPEQNHGGTGAETENSKLAEDIANDRAFEPYHETQLGSSDSAEKGIKGTRTAHKAVKAIIHPRSHVKKTTASTVVNSDSPFLSRKEDDKLVEAVDQLENVEEEAEHGNASGEQVELFRNAVDEIETDRAQTRVSWTMSRYVHRVRAVPRRKYSYPQWSSYSGSKPAGSNFGACISWLGSFMLWISQDYAQQYIDLDDDIGTAALHKPALLEDAERIIVASEPWQEWIIDLHHISRWEDPMRTAKWCAVYIVLLLLNRVFTFIICYGIYSVVRNRTKLSSLEHVRNSQARRHGDKPMRMTDLVGQYGSEGWVDPMLERVGPIVQTQVRDLADFLEILVNFFDWENPAMTAATLFYFGIVLILAVFGSADFNLRVINCLCVSEFFAGRTLASLYPKYRHIVSPIRWVFWNIPTNSELSFLYLQERIQKHCKDNEQGQQQKAQIDNLKDFENAMKTENTSKDDLIRTPIISSENGDWQNSESDRNVKFSRTFHCTYNKRPGHLGLTMENFSFTTTGTDRVHWVYRYSGITEMCKMDGSIVAGYKAPKGLRFEFVNGIQEEIKVSRGRDEIFNTIIGLSGRRWQHLPALK